MLTNKEDGWKWEGDPTGVFTVKSLRVIIDNLMNSPFAGFCFWNKWLPSRVNCFVWRLLQNHIPIKPNLASRGIIMLSEDCSICSDNIESIYHLFHSCPAVHEVWIWFLKWCNIRIGSHSSLEQLVFNVIENGANAKQKLLLEAAVGCLFWCIWKASNYWVFNNRSFSAAKVIEDLQISLFIWLKYKGKYNSLLWSLWRCNPLNLL